MYRWNHIVLICICMAFFACSVNKYVPQQDALYTGFAIKPDKGKLPAEVSSALEKVPRPAPNTRILGIPWKLLIFNAFSEPKKPKGFKYKIKYGLGEKPVLISKVQTDIISGAIADKMFGFGYFNATASDSVVPYKKGKRVVYTVVPDARYRLRRIIFPADSSELTIAIRGTAKTTLLQPGDFINLETLEKERDRIEDALRNLGYYYFSAGHILFKTDSLHNGEADVYLHIKDEISVSARRPWTIDSIDIYANYQPARDSAILKQKGKKLQSFSIIDEKNRYKADVYERALLLKPNQLYNKTLHARSIERIMNLNTFRFTRFTFTPDTTGGQALLHTRIFLTPYKKNTLRLETSANTKTGGFVGSEISINLRNKNLFKGAELLDLRLGAGFDIQVGGGQQQSSNAFTVNAEAVMQIPKLLPGWIKKSNINAFVPKTLITAGASFLQRPDLYTQRTTKLSLEYVWKSSPSIEHRLKPIWIQSIDPSNTTPKFDSILAEDITLKAAFERQIILGAHYQWVFNDTYKSNRRFTKWAMFQVSNSGNIFNALARPSVDTPGAVKIAGIPVAQFVKLEADIRGYWKTGAKTVWANRLIAGSAFAYGNSSVAPYSEQFFIGGSSSIRAFRIRTLGPGSYHTDEKVFRANESGDIKIELNTEWRLLVSKYLQLAAFADAGNIWYRKEAADKPGSGFDRGDLFKEMAVGAGLGIRLDFSILLLRFDVAVPLRKPWLPENERWVISDMQWGSSAWRKENLLLNIGIGYPF